MTSLHCEKKTARLNSKLTTHPSISMDDYMNQLYAHCEKTMPVSKKTEKVTNENVCIPTTVNYATLFSNNYNVQQLKQFAKHYKLKLSGNKQELIHRIYNFLFLSKSMILIQKMCRGHLQRRYNKLHGPAFIKRHLCVNDSDFLSGDPLSTLNYNQFFSYKDDDGFVYGFDILSLYNLIQKSDKQVKNPYSRGLITKAIIKDVRNVIRISRVLRIPISIDIQDVTVSEGKTFEFKVLDLFQKINSLGNYSDPAWFLSLTRHQLIKFMRELIDIWAYRAQLTNDTKKKICPPHGDPFRNIHFDYLYTEENIESIKKIILPSLEMLVNSGINNDNKTLGAYYVLSALTLVSKHASDALPWLFQSVSHV